MVGVDDQGTPFTSRRGNCFVPISAASSGWQDRPVGKCKGTSTEKCDTDAWCRGYCARHYYHLRMGNLDEKFVPVRPPKCAVDGGCDGEHIAAGQCHFGDGPHRSKGLCSFHYFRSLRGIPLDAPVEKPNPARKLTADDVRQMRRLRNKKGQTLRVIAARYGVSECAVSAACTGRTWAHVD